jgi:hypothetical protein
MFEDRVRRGAALLDEVQPGWWREIDTARLAMVTCDRCILGQLYGEFGTGWRVVLSPVRRDWPCNAADHGFTLYDPRESFADLTDAWRAEIARRVDAGVTVP